MRNLLIKLQTIDRRWVYLAVAIACTIPFLTTNMHLDVVPSSETKGVYDAVENLAIANASAPPDKQKFVIIDTGWDQGSMGENQGMTECFIDHCFRRNVKFAIVDVNGSIFAPQFIDKVIQSFLGDDNGKERYGVEKLYGVDWVNLGYGPGPNWSMYQLMAKDMQKAFKKDYSSNSTSDYKKLPIMEHLKTSDDWGLVFAVTYSPSEDWIPYIHGVYGTPIAFGCAGIQSTVSYRFLTSKQLVGMLVGVRGGAEYDVLLNPDKPAARTTLGSQLIVPLAFGHLVIILAVVMGNIGYFAGRRGRREQ